MTVNSVCDGSPLQHTAACTHTHSQSFTNAARTKESGKNLTRSINGIVPGNQLVWVVAQILLTNHSQKQLLCDLEMQNQFSRPVAVCYVFALSGF